MSKIYGILIDGKLVRQSESKDYINGYWGLLGEEDE